MQPYLGMHLCSKLYSLLQSDVKIKPPLASCIIFFFAFFIFSLSLSLCSSWCDILLLLLFLDIVVGVDLIDCFNGMNCKKKRPRYKVYYKIKM